MSRASHRLEPAESSLHSDRTLMLVHIWLQLGPNQHLRSSWTTAREWSPDIEGLCHIVPLLMECSDYFGTCAFYSAAAWPSSCCCCNQFVSHMNVNRNSSLYWPKWAHATWNVIISLAGHVQCTIQRTYPKPSIVKGNNTFQQNFMAETCSYECTMRSFIRGLRLY